MKIGVEFSFFRSILIILIKIKTVFGLGALKERTGVVTYKRFFQDPQRKEK